MQFRAVNKLLTPFGSKESNNLLLVSFNHSAKQGHQFSSTIHFLIFFHFLSRQTETSRIACTFSNWRIWLGGEEFGYRWELGVDKGGWRSSNFYRENTFIEESWTRTGFEETTHRVTELTWKRHRREVADHCRHDRSLSLCLFQLVSGLKFQFVWKKKNKNSKA